MMLTRVLFRRFRQSSFVNDFRKISNLVFQPCSRSLLFDRTIQNVSISRFYHGYKRPSSLEHSIVLSMESEMNVNLLSDDELEKLLLSGEADLSREIEGYQFFMDSTQKRQKSKSRDEMDKDKNSLGEKSHDNETMSNNLHEEAIDMENPDQFGEDEDIKEWKEWKEREARDSREEDEEELEEEEEEEKEDKEEKKEGEEEEEERDMEMKRNDQENINKDSDVQDDSQSDRIQRRYRPHNHFMFNGELYSSRMISMPPEYLAVSYKSLTIIFLGNITLDNVFFPFTFDGKRMDPKTIDNIMRNFFLI